MTTMLSDIQISKTLSYILRHGAVAEGIPIQADGFVLISDILSYAPFAGVSFERVQKIVDSNSKKRFELTQTAPGEGWKIRAAQGHSIKLDGFEYEQITDTSRYPVVLHGTYLAALPSIRAQGLSRMARTHIHFATGLPEADAPISGMRGSAPVVIYVDIAKAISDGIKFYRSSNGVILSEGLDGILPPCYFSKMVDRGGNPL